MMRQKLRRLGTACLGVGMMFSYTPLTAHATETKAIADTADTGLSFPITYRGSEKTIHIDTSQLKHVKVTMTMENDVPKIYLEPEEGYDIFGVYLDGIDGDAYDLTLQEVNGKKTATYLFNQTDPYFDSLQAITNCTLEARMIGLTNDITAFVSGSEAAQVTLDKSSVTEDDEVTLTILPKEGYLLKESSLKVDPSINVRSQEKTDIRHVYTLQGFTKGMAIEAVVSTEKLGVSAELSPIKITGTSKQEITPQDISITLHNSEFQAMKAGDDVTSWFGNALPQGLKAVIKADVKAGATTMQITLSGTPTAASTQAISLLIPAANVTSGNDIRVMVTATAAWSIQDADKDGPIQITSGGGYYVKGSKQEKTISCTGKVKDLQNVYMDGVILAPSNYELNPTVQSTIITLKSEYLDTLSYDDHVLRLEYKDQFIELKFLVTKNASKDTKPTKPKKPTTTLTTTKTNTPNTGDTTSTATFLSILTVSGAGLYVSAKKRKQMR